MSKDSDKLVPLLFPFNAKTYWRDELQFCWNRLGYVCDKGGVIAWKPSSKSGVRHSCIGFRASRIAYNKGTYALSIEPTRLDFDESGKRVPHDYGVDKRVFDPTPHLYLVEDIVKKFAIISPHFVSSQPVSTFESCKVNAELSGILFPELRGGDLDQSINVDLLLYSENGSSDTIIVNTVLRGLLIELKRLKVEARLSSLKSINTLGKGGSLNLSKGAGRTCALVFTSGTKGDIPSPALAKFLATFSKEGMPFQCVSSQGNPRYKAKGFLPGLLMKLGINTGRPIGHKFDLSEDTLYIGLDQFHETEKRYSVLAVTLCNSFGELIGYHLSKHRLDESITSHRISDSVNWIKEHALQGRTPPAVLIFRDGRNFENDEIAIWKRICDWDRCTFLNVIKNPSPRIYRNEFCPPDVGQFVRLANSNEFYLYSNQPVNA